MPPKGVKKGKNRAAAAQEAAARKRRDPAAFAAEKASAIANAMTRAEAEGVARLRGVNLERGYAYVYPAHGRGNWMGSLPGFVKQSISQHEAALAVATELGPDRSYAPCHKLTSNSVAAADRRTKLAATENGEAFGGVFGGYECVGCFLRPPAERCHKVYRSQEYAAAAGTRCAVAGSSSSSTSSHSLCLIKDGIHYCTVRVTRAQTPHPRL